MMNRVLLLLLAAGLAGCAGSPAPPSSTVEPETVSPCLNAMGSDLAPGIVMGFGQGETMAEARQRAYADISEQLSVRIVSAGEARVEKQGGELDSRFRQTLTSHSEAQLSELRLECLDQHSTPGRVFISYSYDRRARAIKVVDRLVDTLGYLPGDVVWQGPEAIVRSPLMLRIDRELQRRQGTGLPTLPVQLLWRGSEKRWSLQLGDLPVSLTLPELQLAVAWHRLQRGDAALATVSLEGGGQVRQIRAESEYRLALKHPRGGYGQLLGIYENGSIVPVRRNIELPPGKATIVPEGGGVFEAALLDGAGTTDTWLLLVTPEPVAAAALPSLFQAGDASQLHSLLSQLENLNGDIAVEQLAVE